MKIIAVLDIAGGVVVHAVAGRRSEYRPLQSQLTRATDPLGVAKALRATLGLTELYLADLDAIGGAEPACSLYAQLQAEDFALWIDAGIRGVEHGQRILPTCTTVVAGLETLDGPEVLQALVAEAPDRVAFSLDLRSGRPLGNLTAWNAPDAWSIATQAIRCGVQHLLVLDLARVGVATGTGTDPLLQKLRHAYPNLTLSAGGGIGSRQDLLTLAQAGVNTALVATALHNQTIQTW